MVSRTAGGLVKRSISFRPEQLRWLQEQAQVRGGSSVDSVVRELIRQAMAAEQVAAPRRAS